MAAKPQNVKYSILILYNDDSWLELLCRATPKLILHLIASCGHSQLTVCKRYGIVSMKLEKLSQGTCISGKVVRLF